MQRLFLLVAVMLLSGCLTAPPKEAARPTLMPRAQSYKDLTHLPAPTGKIFVSVYNIQDETGQFKPYPASNFSTAVPPKRHGNAGHGIERFSLVYTAGAPGLTKPA
ncbi:curli production assembly/transport component [Escherichia coli]|uniref:Curli production assembly/transport component CsgG n=1 Tax=Escherichia coli TaxID=562 RepID=A0A485JIE0_ECOLX|nr:curli production assembly/transport component [Escherichia coli]